MLVVSFVGMVANILGAGLYVLGNHIGEREEKKKENEREDD
jgi:hypothetical protein